MTGRAYTAEEARESFLLYLALMAKYWADLPNKTPLERCNGMAFSILNIFDGTTMNLPAMDIILRPHPDDKPDAQREGGWWYEDGTLINDTSLHEMWGKFERRETVPLRGHNQ